MWKHVVPRTALTAVRAAATATPPAAVGYDKYETLRVTVAAPFVFRVDLNRPDRRNALNHQAWGEIKHCFDTLSRDRDCRVILLTGAGKHFCSGIDLAGLADQFGTFKQAPDAARAARLLQGLIADYQSSFTAIEKAGQPVIAAVHGACVGGGVDMITACDIRYCSADAYFQIKEVGGISAFVVRDTTLHASAQVDIGLAADVGTLQRLPKIVGNQSTVRELAYTARSVPAAEALSLGLVSAVYQSPAELVTAALAVAVCIAEKSPVAVHGTKVNLNFSRDHTVDESLAYMTIWNSAMLQTDDLMTAAAAMMEKKTPIFAKL